MRTVDKIETRSSRTPLSPSKIRIESTTNKKLFLEWTIFQLAYVCTLQAVMKMHNIVHLFVRTISAAAAAAAARYSSYFCCSSAPAISYNLLHLTQSALSPSSFFSLFVPNFFSLLFPPLFEERKTQFSSSFTFFLSFHRPFLLPFPLPPPTYF